MTLELANPGLRKGSPVDRPDSPAGWPIAWLLPILLVGVIFVAMAPLIGIAYFAAQSNFEMQSRERNEQFVDLIEQQLRAHLEPVRAQLAYISDAVARGDVDFDNPEQWRAFALGALAATPQSAGFVFVPVRGDLWRFARADHSMRPERRENIPMADALLDRARTLQGPAWVEPMWSYGIGEPILPIIVPIRVRGEFRGFIGAANAASDLSRFLKGLELPGRHTPFILVGHDKVLAHPYFAKEQGRAEQHARGRLPSLDEVKDPVLAAMWAPDQRELVWLEGATVDGHWNWVGDRSFAWIRRRIADYAPAELTIGFHAPGRESAWGRWVVRGILIAGILLMMLTALVAILVGRRLARPILALADAAGSVERLQLDRLPVLRDSRVRELNQANRAFERMAQGLRLSATYLPRALVSRLIARQGGPPASEDRAITVMFCDLEGYTAYSRGRPAVEAAAYLNDLLGRVGPAIEATGGTIDKYIGDGLMAFWGAPEPSLDHARAACLAALAVAGEVDAFNRARRARGEAACRMRIGLHTGTVVVGNVGFAGRIDYTAVGEAVNVAARLEQFGRHAPRTGEAIIVVSASCHRAAGDGFVCEPLDGGPDDVAPDGTLPLVVLIARSEGQRRAMRR